MDRIKLATETSAEIKSKTEPKNLTVPKKQQVLLVAFTIKSHFLTGEH